MAQGVRDALLSSDDTQTITATGTGDWVKVGEYMVCKAVLTVGGDVTGTNPTLDVTIQGSSDGSGSSDATLATFAQVTDEMVGYVDASPATARPEVPGEDPLEVWFSTGAYPWVRSSWTIGGTASPTFPLTTIAIFPQSASSRQTGTL